MEIGKSQQHQQGSLGRAESENNPAACKASNNKTLLRWPLSKYAYFVNDEEKSAEEATQGKKKWHERVAQHKPPNMWIQITQRRFLQILHGDMLVECCPLPDARRNWRSFRRNHEMIFQAISSNKTARKFRIRFLSNGHQDAIAVAQSCQNYLSRYITFCDLQSGVQQPAVAGDEQSCIELKQLAQAILQPQHCKWPKSYLDIGKNNADVEGAVNHMQVLVQSCLMDPGFPSLVEAVEKSLKKVMSFEDV